MEKPLEVTSRPSNVNHTFPFELLGEILLYIADDSLDLRYALVVCRSWYNATAHHAKLWTNIVLGYQFLTRFRGDRLPHADAFVRLCLSRSSPHPLCISVHDSDCSHLYQSAKSYECLSLVEHIIRKSGERENLFQRCKSLSWFLCKGSEEISIVSRALNSASFPSLEFPALEYLTIKNLRIVGDELQIYRFPRLPRLKEVTMINHSGRCTPPFFHDDDFARAERLSLTVTDRWRSDNFICIGRFQSIRTLILQEIETNANRHWGSLGRPLSPVGLPLLEALALLGSVEPGILNLIEAPGIKRMRIQENTSQRHSLRVTNLNHLVQSVEYLYVWLSEDDDTTFTVEELAELVDEAPSLISLFVSPWMEEHLREYEWADVTRNLRLSPILDCSKQLLEI